MALRVIIVAVLSAMYSVSSVQSLSSFDRSGANPGHCSCTDPASVGRFVAVEALERTPRAKLRQGSKSWQDVDASAAAAQRKPRQDFSPCSCSECLGEHKNDGAWLEYRLRETGHDLFCAGGDGSVGFQCFPKTSGGSPRVLPAILRSHLQLG